MKVALITILDNTNFGTYLQALATGKVIQELGYEIEVITYIRSCMTAKGMSKALFEDRGPLRWLKRVWEISPAIKLRDIDLKFLSEYLPMTRKYESYDDLYNAPPVADVYLTGSDQVWNSYYNRGIDKGFFLDFAPKDKKRVAYAASIGMDTIPDDEVGEFVKLLKKYSSISVRETGAKKLLAKYNIASTVVLDPTLLLNNNSWYSIANKYSSRGGDEPYLLVYSVENKKENKLLERYAHEIAKKRGLKLYQVSYSSRKKMLKTVDKRFDRATPEMFLSLMINASFVLVSSFHGTAFSVNFNKQFLTVVPGRFNSRVSSLLEIIGLQSRMISDNNFNIENLSDIDYTEVNCKLENERTLSLNYLKSILRG